MNGSQRESEVLMAKIQNDEVMRNRRRVGEILAFKKKILGEISHLEDLFL